MQGDGWRRLESGIWVRLGKAGIDPQRPASRKPLRTLTTVAALANDLVAILRGLLDLDAVWRLLR